MAINKVMKAALKALSYPDIDLKENYKKIRKLEEVARKDYLKPFYRTWENKIELDDHEIPVRIFSPNEETVTGPVLIFFHGGGWVTGNIDTYDKVCRTLSVKTGYRVASIDYRLAPEFPFPSGLEDCYKATQIILKNYKMLNASADEIYTIGDSAGANFVAAVSLMARDKGELMPKKQILLYPAVNNDFSENSQFESVRTNGTDYLLTSKRMCDYMELYKTGDEDLTSPYFSPLMAKDYSNQPETLIITAEFDPLRDEGEEYGKRLKEGKNFVEMHRMPDALHGFIMLPDKYPPVKETYEYIDKFLKRSSLTDGTKNYKME